MIKQLISNYNTLQEFKRIIPNIVVSSVVQINDINAHIIPRSCIICDNADYQIFRIDRRDNIAGQDVRSMRYYYSHEHNLIGCLTYIIADMYVNAMFSNPYHCNVLEFNDIKLSDVQIRQLQEQCIFYFTNLSNVFYYIEHLCNRDVLPDVKFFTDTWSSFQKSAREYVIDKMIKDHKQKDATDVKDMKKLRGEIKDLTNKYDIRRWR